MHERYIRPCNGYHSIPEPSKWVRCWCWNTAPRTQKWGAPTIAPQPQKWGGSNGSTEAPKREVPATAPRPQKWGAATAAPRPQKCLPQMPISQKQVCSLEAATISLLTPSWFLGSPRNIKFYQYWFCYYIYLDQRTDSPYLGLVWLRIFQHEDSMKMIYIQ